MSTRRIVLTAVSVLSVVLVSFGFSTAAQASVPYQQVRSAPQAKVWPEKYQVRIDHGTYVHWKVDKACGDVHATSDPWNQRWFLINFRDHASGSHLFYFQQTGDYMFGLESDSGCSGSAVIHVVRKGKHLVIQTVTQYNYSLAA